MEKKTQKTIILTSVLYLILGLALIIWPSLVRTILCYVIGAAGIVLGAYMLIDFFKNKDVQYKKALSLTIAIICIIAGLFLIFKAKAIVQFFAVVIGIAVIADSIMKLNISIKLKNAGSKNWGIYLILALVMLAIGVVLLFDPFKAANAATVVAGVVLVINAGSGLFMAVKD